MIGWHPSSVNYDKWPGLTPEKLEAALRADENKLNQLGYQASIGFIHSAETAAADVTAALHETAYDIILIGAGVRTDDDHFLVFEQLVNVVHQCAPQARICFNSGPHDSDQAVRRWS